MSFLRFFICSFTVLLWCATPSFAQERDPSLEKQVFRLINQYRHEKGLSELQYMDDAADVAYTHTEAMAAGRRRFGHDGFEGRFNLIKKTQPDMHGFAENVAYGQLDAAGAVDLWLHSTGHRKNIEGNYEFTGIGVARAKNGDYYFTQVFLRR